jgi:hypothetical protein
MSLIRLIPVAPHLGADAKNMHHQAIVAVSNRLSCGHPIFIASLSSSHKKITAKC